MNDETRGCYWCKHKELPSIMAPCRTCYGSEYPHFERNTHMNSEKPLYDPEKVKRIGLDFESACDYTGKGWRRLYFNEKAKNREISILRCDRAALCSEVERLKGELAHSMTERRKLLDIAMKSVTL